MEGSFFKCFWSKSQSRGGMRKADRGGFLASASELKWGYGSGT